MLLSDDPLASNASEEKTTECTPPEWPSKATSIRLSSKLQTFMLLSADPQARSSPSREKTTTLTGFELIAIKSPLQSKLN
jgi:hypothetical protein